MVQEQMTNLLSHSEQSIEYLYLIDTAGIRDIDLLHCIWELYTNSVFDACIHSEKLEQ